MLKLLKNLKPYTFAILVIFGLLYGQAMTDLALPGYMSKIVNIGIQQNGIENAVPEAIRSDEMDKLTLFMSAGDKAAVMTDYTLLDKQQLSTVDYNAYLKEYPDLENDTIYILNNDQRSEIDKLNDIFGKPILIVSAIESGGLSSMAVEGFSIPAGIDPFDYFKNLPVEQKATVLNMISTYMDALPESTITQSAVAYLAGEYKTIGLDLTGIQTGYILNIGGIMLLLSLAGAAASISVGYLASWVAAAFSRDTRRKIFHKVTNFSNVEFDKFSTASLITRNTNDVLQIQMMLVFLLRMIFYAPILGVGAFIKVLGEDASLSWIIVVAVGTLVLLIGIIFIIAVPKFRIVQKMIDRLNLVSREILSGIMVIRAFNTQKYEEKKFDEANVNLTNVNLFINKVMVFMMPMMMFVMNGTMLLIIWFGAKQIDAGSLQVGSMMAFMQYAMQIIMSFLMVSMMFVMLPRASVSAQRISQVLETDPVIKDPPAPKKFDENGGGKVEFQNVSFKYPGADDYILHNISFIASPGTTTAFIGSTGSGKSTLVNLIPRFYDVSEGEILVNGIDIREVTQHDLRDKIGYIPQKNILFSGTIESNIRYGKDDISDEDVRRAATTAQSADFISGSGNGYQTDIAQSGTNLSGGQRQRLAIARALAKKPPIFIFDDSFSAVDFKTDAALRRALKKETGDATVLIVAQRISTIMNADKIIVLDNGKVVGIGSHKELMTRCDVYRELALSQLSKEELE